MIDTSLPAALVTGASSGIGKAFAEELALRRGRHLIIVARRKPELETLAGAIRADWASRDKATPSEQVIVLPCDLVSPMERANLLKEIGSLNVFIDLLVNNAGFGSLGPFAESDAAWEERMIALNCTVPLILSRHFLPAMCEKRRGGIINVASTAAFQPMPYMATYGATKAFLVSFSLALAAEVARHNVRVVAHCPGPTQSEFHLVVGLEDKIHHLGAMDAREVAAQALSALERGSKLVINGWRNRALAQVSRFLPRAAQAWLIERVLRSARSSIGAPRRGG